MKALLIITALFLSQLNLQAQYVNGTHLEDINASYIVVEVQHGMFKNQFRVGVDVGQEAYDTRWNRNVLKDKQEAPVRFNSEVHLFNYLADFGYDYVEEITTGNNNVLYLFRLKRKQKPENTDYFQAQN